jgi:uncharacterized protein (DUF2267 family)
VGARDWGAREHEEAEKAIRATFETLKQRLAGNEPGNLAVQFSKDFAAPL